MKSFKDWGTAAAARDRPKPMTTVSMIYLFTTDGGSLAFTDRTVVEEVDKETGEITEKESRTFLPKSQISVAEVDSLADLVKGKAYTIRLPEWLAKDRRLI